MWNIWHACCLCLSSSLDFVSYSKSKHMKVVEFSFEQELCWMSDTFEFRRLIWSTLKLILCSRRFTLGDESSPVGMFMFWLFVLSLLVLVWSVISFWASWTWDSNWLIRLAFRSFDCLSFFIASSFCEKMPLRVSTFDLRNSVSGLSEFTLDFLCLPLIGGSFVLVPDGGCKEGDGAVAEERAADIGSGNGSALGFNNCMLATVFGVLHMCKHVHLVTILPTTNLLTRPRYRRMLKHSIQS